MARYLSVTSIEEFNEYIVSQEEIVIKDKSFHNMLKILSKEEIEHLIVDRIDEIVVDIMRLAFDPCHIKTSLDIEIRLPEPQPPFFPVGVTLHCITYVEVCFCFIKDCNQFISEKKYILHYKFH